jgi:hypothetical protein
MRSSAFSRRPVAVTDGVGACRSRRLTMTLGLDHRVSLRRLGHRRPRQHQHQHQHHAEPARQRPGERVLRTRYASGSLWRAGCVTGGGYQSARTVCGHRPLSVTPGGGVLQATRTSPNKDLTGNCFRGKLWTQQGTRSTASGDRYYRVRTGDEDGPWIGGSGCVRRHDTQAARQGRGTCRTSGNTSVRQHSNAATQQHQQHRMSQVRSGDWA